MTRGIKETHQRIDFLKVWLGMLLKTQQEESILSRPAPEVMESLLSPKHPQRQRRSSWPFKSKNRPQTEQTTASVLGRAHKLPFNFPTCSKNFLASSIAGPLANLLELLWNLFAFSILGLTSSRNGTYEQSQKDPGPKSHQGYCQGRRWRYRSGG